MHKKVAKIVNGDRPIILLFSLLWT